MTVIGIANQKGGVAKTSTAGNLGYCLSTLNKKILIIDMDPQANLSHSLNVYEKENTIYEALMGDIDLNKAIRKTDYENLDIIPANIKLANVELELSTVLGRESILRELLEEANLDYDFIIIDCNPALGLLTVNSLVATNKVIIPMEAAEFSLEGIEQLTNLINLIRKKINHSLSIMSVLLTRVIASTNIAKEFDIKLREIFVDKVFETVIHQNVKITEAQSAKQPVNVYDSASKGAIEYMDLAREVLKHGN